MTVSPGWVFELHRGGSEVIMGPAPKKSTKRRNHSRYHQFVQHKKGDPPSLSLDDEKFSFFNPEEAVRE